MARKGNKTWELRSKHGRDLTFSSSEALLSGVKEYFDYTDKNPIYINEVVRSGTKAGKILKIPTQRPYTIAALVHFLGISHNTWKAYRTRPEFTEAIKQVENYIYNQKLELALTGVYNPTIAARHLGLVENVDNTTKGESINKGFFEFIKKVNTVNND